MPTIHYASHQFLKQINWSPSITADGLITSNTSSPNNHETRLTSTTYASGRLTQIEQEQFENGIVKFGMGKWKDIANGIPTRSKAQVVAIGNYLKRNNKSSIKELYLGRPKKQPVDVEIVMKQTIPQKVCTITPVDLRRVNDEVIWVLVGKSEHPAYLLNDGSSSSSSSSSSVNNGMVWVEWLSNGRKECIAKQQIVIGGLQSRKRSRPNHLEDFVLSSQAGAECLLLLSGKDMSAIEKPQPVSSKNDELQSLAYDISTGSGHDQLPSRSVTPLDQPHLFGLSVDWTCTCGKIVAGEKKRRHCNKWREGKRRDAYKNKTKGQKKSVVSSTLDPEGYWNCTNCENTISNTKSRCGKCHRWRGGKRKGGWKIKVSQDESGIEWDKDWMCYDNIIPADKTRCGKCNGWRGGKRCMAKKQKVADDSMPQYAVSVEAAST